ncbi:hypothetical protein Hte_003313 [Hypoxylon texense]
MASDRSQTTGGFVSRRNGANALPTAFKCAVDGQWLEPVNFSQKQLAKWFQKKKGMNDGVTPENIGLVCKGHNGQGGIQEIKCHGPCSAWKFREHFSKNQRNEPEPWCVVCTSWTFQFGGTEVPLPPPSSKLSTDEIIAQTTMVQDQLPDIPSRDTPRGSAVGTTALMRAARNNGGGRGNHTVGPTQGMNGEGVVGRVSILSNGEKDQPEDHTQQLASRRTTTSQSNAGRATSSITQPVQSSQTSLSVVTRGQSSAEDNSSVTVTEEQVTGLPAPQEIAGEASGEARRPSAFVRGSARWAKGDSRKVFYVPPSYTGRPEDHTGTDDPEWSDDDF